MDKKYKIRLNTIKRRQPMDWHCSNCGAPAYYDGRCGDGPVLMCGCDKGAWIDDGRGGYTDNPTGAKPIEGKHRKKKKKGDRKIIKKK